MWIESLDKKGQQRLHEDPVWKSEFIRKLREGQNKRINSPDYIPSFLGKSHTKETKRKISESTKVTSKGDRNSQYGTKWIHSLVEKKSKKISKDDPIPEGWIEGRKMKF